MSWPTLSDIAQILHTEGFRREAEDLRTLRNMLTEEQIEAWQAKVQANVEQKYGRG